MAVGAHLQPCTPIRKYVYINLHELLKCLCTFIIKFIIMQVIKYIYSLSMLVPSSAYLLQPFILKLILRGPSQSILGCFAGCVWSRRGYVCGGTYICVGVAGDMCAGKHVWRGNTSALQWVAAWVWLGQSVSSFYFSRLPYLWNSLPLPTLSDRPGPGLAHTIIPIKTRGHYYYHSVCNYTLYST